jgi:hypothetical protein
MQNMPERKSVTLLLLYIVGILLAISFCTVMFNRWQYYRVVDAIASKEAKQLQMKVAYADGKLRLFVDEHFPERLPFKLYDLRQQLLLSERVLKQEYQNNKILEASLALGMDFELKCFYTLDGRIKEDGNRYLDNGINLLELRLQKGNQIQYDLDADGVYDLRYACETSQPHDNSCKYAVWYENQWRDVVDTEPKPKYTKSLPDGTVLDFDLNLGQWVVSEVVEDPTIAPAVPDEENN